MLNTVSAGMLKVPLLKHFAGVQHWLWFVVVGYLLCLLPTEPDQDCDAYRP